MDAKIIPDSIRDVLAYDPRTGDLTWKVDRQRARAGSVAGGVNRSTGYIQVCYNYVNYRAHRVAWFLAHDEQPYIIDHINRDKGDNRLANLRNVGHVENQLNQQATGISWGFKSGRRIKYVTARYRSRYLYTGKDITTAWFRRIMAERADHPIGLPAPV